MEKKTPEDLQKMSIEELIVFIVGRHKQKLDVQKTSRLPKDLWCVHIFCPESLNVSTGFGVSLKDAVVRAASSALEEGVLY
jgi:hypothetical protein